MHRVHVTCVCIILNVPVGRTCAAKIYRLWANSADLVLTVAACGVLCGGSLCPYIIDCLLANDVVTRSHT